MARNSRKPTTTPRPQEDAQPLIPTHILEQAAFVIPITPQITIENIPDICNISIRNIISKSSLKFNKRKKTRYT